MTTPEFPYAVARGGTVTADRARAFGRDLARAIVRWMAERQAPRYNAARPEARENR